MNLLKIISEIEKLDPEVYEKLNSRRAMFKHLSSSGMKFAAAAVPLFLGTALNKAYAQSSAVPDILNYALTLEYLEDEFYKSGLAAAGLIPENRRVIFQQISKHETAHVGFLKAVLGQLSATPVAKPTFDFTAGGVFADVFTNYQTFLALSQAFEDTGVRAYKGRAGELLGNATVLTAALQIHSVEARHASMVRRLRAEKGWITGNSNSGLPAAIYAGEDNVTQGGASITGLGYSAAAATEAFDEPLTPDDVLAIAGGFIVS
ncbi:MAG TPA: ferritin-like domain-containing protein [Chryseolinea sp.]|nr:ferritin-like domain-containing protein [Chryseolinea sp.]